MIQYEAWFIFPSFIFLPPAKKRSKELSPTVVDELDHPQPNRTLCVSLSRFVFILWDFELRREGFLISLSEAILISVRSAFESEVTKRSDCETD